MTNETTTVRATRRDEIQSEAAARAYLDRQLTRIRRRRARDRALSFRLRRERMTERKPGRNERIRLHDEVI